MLLFFTESLDELEDIVLRLFSDVKDKSVIAPRWEEHPFKQESMRTLAYVCPVKDIRNLNIIFPSRDLQEYYKSAVSNNVLLDGSVELECYIQWDFLLALIYAKLVFDLKEAIVCY